MPRVRAGAAAMLAILLGGCAGQWVFNREEPIARTTTEVTVRTQPAGADVSVNGEYIGQSPLTVPLRYSYEVRVYERRCYLPWPHVESRQVPSYAREFRFSARTTGFSDAEQVLIPTGEEKLDLRIVLRPR
jgi:hypothetical protein